MKSFGAALKRFFILVVIIGILIGGGYFVYNYYGFIFSKKVVGEILEVERVTQPAAILGSARLSPEYMYSFAVAIRSNDGRIHTASSEDRQWAVARKGACVESEYYPYPPWDLQKRGTYRNARLIQLMDCRALNISPTSTPAAPAP